MQYYHDLCRMFQNHRWFGILLVVGVIGFLVYRFADWLQFRFVRQYPQPKDLERLTPEMFQSKRRRKILRSWAGIWKGTANWLLQTGFVVLAIPFLVVFMNNKGLSYTTIYIILMVVGYILNILFSKLFSLWTPGRLSTEVFDSVWRLDNLAVQAWGLATWAIPTYFFWTYFETNGWIGSVITLFVAQIVQLLFFIFTIKRSAIAYQDYPGLSKEFKKNLQKYLQSHGLRDDEVGILTNVKMGPNAFATSLLGYKQIILTEELVNGYADPGNPQFVMKLGDDTLEAIVAHEVGHIKKHHIEKSIIFGTMVSAFVTVGVYQLFSANPTSYFMFTPSTTHQILLYWGQSIFNLMLLYPLTFLMMNIAQSNETQSDTFMLETNGCKNGQDFFHQIRHIAPLANHAFWHDCNMTHPEPEAREQRMIEWTKEHCK